MKSEGRMKHLVAGCAALVAALLAGCPRASSSTTPRRSKAARRRRRPGRAGAGAAPPPARPVAGDAGRPDARRDAADAALPRSSTSTSTATSCKDEYRPTVEAYAKALAADRKKKMTVEGHTDERGGREYNLALGQKRAEAVPKSMALMGGDDSQIEAVSFGKERPAVQGSDEAAWAKNRRAELTQK